MGSEALTPAELSGTREPRNLQLRDRDGQCRLGAVRHVVGGDDLFDYVAHEFKVPPLHPSPDRANVPFWSAMAEGAENRDL